MAAACLGTLAAFLALAAVRCERRTAPPASAHAGPPLRAVANVTQLMAGLIDPAADTVWESVGTIVSAAGTEERRPRTDEEWLAVRNAALHLTEGGNLLMLGDRAKDQEAWWRMSRALVDAGAVALEAAERKSVQGVFDAGEGITIACDNCHNVYWREPATTTPNTLNTPLPASPPPPQSTGGRGDTPPAGTAK